MGRRPLLPSEALNYVRKPPTPPQPMVGITLTDNAWEYLVSRAVLLQYVRAGAMRAKGMSKYLWALTTPVQQWTDTRPPYLIALSERLLDPSKDVDRRRFADGSPTSLFSPELPRAPAAHRPGPTHPIWWDPDLDGPRNKHVFIKAQIPLEYFANLALQFGIGDPYHRTFRTHPNTLASNALEAIGRQTLTPSVEIPNAHPVKSAVRRWRPTEIAW